MKLTCKEATRLVSQGLDRKLGPWDRLRVRLHLAICDACSAFARQMQFLRRAIQRLS
jgi:predicted anti-sigma-YlaC factor YlaD